MLTHFSRVCHFEFTGEVIDMGKKTNKQIIIYKADNTPALSVMLKDEDVWLTQAQIAELYVKNKSSISEHIKHIFQEGELKKDSVVRNFRTTGTDGKNYNVAYHNLDVIIAVGYRVRSTRGTAFRKWATKRLREAIEEARNPDLAVKRARQLYKAKGHSEKWINERIKGIGARNALTDEWKERGIQGAEYGKLTAIVSKETFNITPKEHKELKQLKPKENLRNNMTALELTLISLAEQTTIEIAKQEDAQGFRDNKKAAHIGGQIAGGTRRAIESRIGRKVVSSKKALPENFFSKLDSK